jgi:uncharacterized protein (TIGR04255 family)
MAFPDAQRVIYERNPLDEVICQLRFPAILKIDEPPVAFQEQVRTRYPFYVRKPTLKLPPTIPAELSAMLTRELPGGMGPAAHEFTSRDQKWTLSLTREFLALTCRAYLRWEEFKDHLAEPLDALRQCYAPGFFVRIGLRYRDVIRRSALGLEGVGWDALLKPWIAGAFARPEAAADVEASASQTCIRLPDGRSRVLAQHGTGLDEGGSEVVYMIDADFFDDKQTEPNDALSRLDFLNGQARLFFRWCIDDRLHEAMRPAPVLPG